MFAPKRSRVDQEAEYDVDSRHFVATASPSRQDGCISSFARLEMAQDWRGQFGVGDYRSN